MLTDLIAMALAIISGQRRIRSVVGFASGIEFRLRGSNFIGMADGIMSRPGVVEMHNPDQDAREGGGAGVLQSAVGAGRGHLLLRLAWFAVHP